jgi:hypothetical protein
MSQHLGAWLISPGVTTEIWRLRLRLGLGLALVEQSNEFKGEENSSTQLPFAYQLGVAYKFLDQPHFNVDGDLRYVQAMGADVTFVMLGVTARGQAITF